MYFAPYGYSYYNPYPYPYYVNAPMYNYERQHPYYPFAEEIKNFQMIGNWQLPNAKRIIDIRDYGKEPFVVNIDEASKQNNTFRTALWTGTHLQVTLMSIDVGGDIGLEVHPHVDQFLRIEDGEGIVQMGNTKDNLYFQERVRDNFAIMVPAGTWHNLTNTGNKPIKLYTIYAPPNHPFGTVHKTQADAMAAEESHGES